ncbi:MAG: site-specific integrase [Vicinamibacteria bacterium]|nr:site-specific integrase [Vicinamibacteria bacterium]
MKIAAVGAIPLDKVFERARAIAGRVAEGKDPEAERREERRTQGADTPKTVEDLARAYIAHGLTKKGKAKKARTIAEERGLFGLREEPATERAKKLVAKDKRRRRTILDAIGTKPLDRVDQTDLVRLKDAWKSTPVRCNRALALISSMYSFAISRGFRKDRVNPAVGVERYPEEPRLYRSKGSTTKVYLTPEEIGRLSTALSDVEKEGRVTPFGVAAIRLLALTGARASEILTLRWDDVRADEGMAALSDSKTGRKELRLPAGALSLLASIPRLAGNPFVIPAIHRRQRKPKPGKPFVILDDRKDRHLTLNALEQIWQQVRERADLRDVHLHDLRHSFASSAIASGASLLTVAGLLGHASARTSERYAHLTGDALSTAANAAGQRIAQAMASRKAVRRKTNVAAFPRGASR